MNAPHNAAAGTQKHFSLAAATVGFVSSTFGLITLMVVLAAA
jgi:hypothetical protein